MADITFEQLMQAVQKLTAQQKALLAQSLHETSVDLTPSREELLGELEALRKLGAFKHVESLRNQYANPAVDDLTDEQLSADIHDAATEWEQELDEFFGDEI
jgi:hypothetical protein